MKPNRGATHYARMRHGATVAGVPLDLYQDALARGEKWCTRHKSFHPLAAFKPYRSKPSSSCMGKPGRKRQQ